MSAPVLVPSQSASTAASGASPCCFGRSKARANEHLRLLGVGKHPQQGQSPGYTGHRRYATASAFVLFHSATDTAAPLESGRPPQPKINAYGRPFIPTPSAFRRSNHRQHAAESCIARDIPLSSNRPRNTTALTPLSTASLRRFLDRLSFTGATARGYSNFPPPHKHSA
ncbi:hypothetical protein C8R45DRAFT_991012 [Mycena sanguinolenta]|nr:hypothetical protein C8R45DRAFT_991012 [Mycena sanguinolenta]